jgi:hypothetical protein
MYKNLDQQRWVLSDNPAPVWSQACQIIGILPYIWTAYSTGQLCKMRQGGD